MEGVLAGELTEVGGEPGLNLLFTCALVDACALRAKDEQCRTHRLHVARLNLARGETR